MHRKSNTFQLFAIAGAVDRRPRSMRARIRTGFEANTESDETSQLMEGPERIFKIVFLAEILE